MKDILILIGMVIIGFVLAMFTASQFEKAECMEWRKQAEQYPLYESAQWQLEQCSHYKLDLPK